MQKTGRRIAWRLPSVSADGLKIFACATMLVQSIGITIIEKGIINLDQYTQAELSEAMAQDSHLMVMAGIGSVMQLIGGLAVPLFAYLLVEGFRNTSDYRKYLLSMVVFALASEIPYDLANSQKVVDWSSQNAIFYLFYSKNVLKTILGMITSLLYVTGPLSFYGIWFYNEQRKDILPKYVYYAFYPVHLLVLGIITINIL